MLVANEEIRTPFAISGLFEGCRTVLSLFALCMLAACGGSSLPEAPLSVNQSQLTKASLGSDDYRISAGDMLNIFVWQDSELSVEVPVRPDGRISIPLIGDVKVAGQTPSRLGRQLEDSFRQFVKEPVVTVVVTSFAGSLNEQIRIVGQAAQPASIAYREGMTALDAVIAVGGLTEFADGNQTTLVRDRGGKKVSYRVRLEDLITDGDISANPVVLPGDVLIIPQTAF